MATYKNDILQTLTRSATNNRITDFTKPIKQLFRRPTHFVVFRTFKRILSSALDLLHTTQYFPSMRILYM